MAKIIVLDKDGTTRVLESSPFQYEAALQDHIARLPGLLPLESVSEDAVSHLTIGTEWSIGNGRADVVLVGSDGVLTVVETKLAKNPEARRQVVAQLIEYAAYFSEYTALDLQREAEAYHQKTAADTTGATLDSTVSAFLEECGVEADAASFWRTVEMNLREGRIRLIVAVDEAGEQAQKIITFLNAFSSFDIYLLQISEFEDHDGRRSLVPSLYGYARKVQTQRASEHWTWERLGAEWSQEEVERARDLTARLAAAFASWQPEVRLHQSWTTLHLFGRALCGVQLYKTRGAEFWFLMGQEPQVTLPNGVDRRQTKAYLYLAGDLDSLSEDSIRDLGKTALAQAAIEVPQ